MDRNAPLLWWLAAGGLVAIELATGTFSLLMLALGCVAGALAAHAGLGSTAQMATAALLAPALAGGDQRALLALGGDLRLHAAQDLRRRREVLDLVAQHLQVTDPMRARCGSCDYLTAITQPAQTTRQHDRGLGADRHRDDAAARHRRGRHGRAQVSAA